MTGLIAIEAPEYFVSERELYATVTLVRSGDISGTATVTVTPTSGTATAGTDFVEAASTVDFGRRVGRRTITIAIVDDKVVEPKEQFQITLSGTDPGSALGTRKTAIVTIEDDDELRASPPPDALIPEFRVSATPVGTNFRAPVTMVFMPGSSVALVAEKGGYIKALDLAKEDKPTVLADLREDVNSYGERGLLGLALHPDLQHHPYLYAFYVVDPPGTGNRTGAAGRDGAGNRFSHLVRLTLDLSGPLPKVVPESRVVLLGKAGRTIADIAGGGALDFTDAAYQKSRATNVGPDGAYKRDLIKEDSQTHVGGAIAFGPDGALYVSTGDGSSYLFADQRAENAQDIDSLNGKVLRLDPLSGLGLPDNPFADGDLGDNRSKVWALGLRNPYTMTFAPDGRLFASETGWDSWEEINVVARAGNYGWPYFEGGDHGELLPTAGFADDPANAAFYAGVSAGQIAVTPAYRAFSHDEQAPGIQVAAIVGAGSIYTGDRYPAELTQNYFFTDIVDGEIYAVDINDAEKLRYITDLGSFGPTSFRQGPDGYMYLTDMVNDRLLRLEISAF